jgi:hypothetical protein
LVQNPWESWDKNYPLVRYTDIIKSENSYAITVEQNPKIAQYFSRLDKYKIRANYLGKFRPIDNGVISL